MTIPSPLFPDTPLSELLAALPKRKKPVRKVKPVVPQWCKDRYEQAHYASFSKVIKDSGHYFKTKLPDTSKANGLTQAIVKFLLWSGCRATRIMSAGRVIDGKYIPGTTRRGAADISSTIKGMSVMWEVKINFDKPSPEQLREQELEERAGGKYFFVKTFEGFLNLYDTL